MGSNNSVPIGRKPALPPKPPNPLRLSLLKPKGYSCITENSNGKSSKIKLDPAELSLKERLALFEKNKVAVPGALSNKTQLKMSVPVKPVSIHEPKSLKFYKTTDKENERYIVSRVSLPKLICGN